jgi:hypothetical protein
LWLFGWRLHRFWIVLLATVTAGIYGLLRAPDYHSQPLLSGILLAIASGLLALALVRVVAFVAGGMAAALLVQALMPSWDEPLVCFLVGGLIGLVLFRVWTMALTSLAGSILLAYSGLSLADQMGKLKAVDWSERQTLLLDWLCGGAAVVGLIGQFLLERRRNRRLKAAEQKAQKKRDKEKQARAEPPSLPVPWWRSLGDRILRRAG